MHKLSEPRVSIRFGAFEWDPTRSEVRRDGVRLRLSGQPLAVLAVLLERADRLVTREELHSRLWDERTFVDFEQGLNTAIARLRQALGDSAEQPRYIATVPGRGYRFIAPVSGVAPPAAVPPADVAARFVPGIDRRTWIAGGLGLALGAAGVYVGTGRVRAPASPTGPLRFVASGPPLPALALSMTFRDVAISPDGRRIVYRASADGAARLFTRALEELDGRFLPGADVYSPFFSPDGMNVGFYEFSGKALMRASVLGGPASVLVRELGFVMGAVWLRDGSIVFATGDPGTGLMRVGDGGGTPEPLTEPGPGINHVLPDALPGEESLLFVIVDVTDDDKPSTIAALDLRTRRIVPLIAGSHPCYTAAGYLLYILDSDLMAVRFDAQRLEVLGTPVAVLEGVQTSALALARVGQYDVSENGTLLAVLGTDASERRLVWVDRSGQESDMPVPRGGYTYPRISPDGRRIALNLDGRIEIWDVNRQDAAPFASGPGLSLYPVWSADAARLVYLSGPPISAGLYIKAVGSGAEARLIDEGELLRAPYFFSPDGAAVGFAEQDAGGVSLRLMPIDATSGSRELVRGARNADLSPDGTRIAYQSDESGRFEIYVRSFPDTNGRLAKASIGGGIQPVWSPAGGELFYIDPGPPARLMSVSIADSDGFDLSPPEALFDWPYYLGELGRTYDVSRPDGRRFLAVKAGAANGVDAGSEPVVELVLDWFLQLQARASGA